MSKPAPAETNGSAILTQPRAAETRRYLERHGYAPTPVLPQPDPNLDLVVVIPALAEPDTLTTLESVAAAARPACSVEVLLVVNAPDDADRSVNTQNERTLHQAREWAAARRTSAFRCHVLDYRNLPREHAGVGLARKLGLDAGLARLTATGSGRGVLVWLDADCRVSGTYLSTIHEWFRHHPEAVAATIHFEHPIDDTDAALRRSIIDYELHLRCYRHGLLAAGSRYAHYTVGSALAVRSEVYAQEGGMNRRKAGEDFYFVNKLLKRGEVGEIADATVFPAARVSARVPFGTGAALAQAPDKAITTYAPAVYRELHAFLSALESSVLADRQYPAQYAGFLDETAFETWLAKTRRNVASRESLSRQLGRWMDGFRTLKFIHWLSASRYPRVAPAEAAREMLGIANPGAPHDPRQMLEALRAADRRGTTIPVPVS